MTLSSSQKEEYPSARVPLSPLENLSVGAFGGALETCLQMPILTYKFCVQEGRALPTSFAGWYRGVFIQASTVAPITALQFMINGLLQRAVLLRNGDNKHRTTLSDRETIATSAAAGAISAIVYTPVDLITIQQQKLSFHPYQTAHYIVNQYGLAGLLRGFSSCAVREALYSAGYLGIAPLLTCYLSQHLFSQQQPSLAAGIAGASLAGIFVSTLTHPVDTCKTLVQSDLSKRIYPNAIATASILYRRGGLSSLFVGLIPRVTRICGAFFICMSLRDMAITYKTTYHCSTIL